MGTNSILAGVRVIELGGYWAAPYAAALLADMGAEVIKIESVVHPDLRLPPRIENGKTVLDGMPFFNVVNRNKLGCTINLQKPRGVAVLKKLARSGDILIENYSVAGRRKLGIDYSDLAPECPNLVYVSLSGFGSEGPGSHLRAYGPTLEAMSGLNSILGYPGGPPGNIGVGLTDPLGGVYGAVAALAGLHLRRTTGNGVHVDIAQLEGVMSCLPEAITEYFMNGSVPQPAGNDDHQPPSGVFASAGTDQWIALSVQSDDDWARLVSLIGEQELASADFSDVAGRIANRSRIESLIGKWLAARTKEEAARLLNSAGLAAAPVLRVQEVLDNPHIRSRSVFQRVEGTLMYSPMLAIADGGSTIRRPPITRPAPRWGIDNEYVFRELLAMEDSEIEMLVNEGVLA